MRIPVVKEWGSWAVLSTACLSGLITGLMARPWLDGREFANETVLTILGLIMLVNSKNPLASTLKSKGKREHVLWFMFFTLSGFFLLIPFLSEGIGSFFVFVIPVLSYSVLLVLKKEHSLVTELNGFALLTVAAPVIYFTVTGQMSWELYTAVTVYFAAGVFKVRVRVRKTVLFRGVMVLYCLVAVMIFHLMGRSVILLLPLVENIISAVWMREERLRMTGNIELAKSIVFLILISAFWN